MKNSRIYQFLIFFLIISNGLFSQPAGYGFGKQILIDPSQVSGTIDHLNFPILVSLTDPDLRTTANGGNVENANGFDILFTGDDCNTILDHQLERYNPTTGELIAWVRVPVLSVTINTIIVMYYGNSTITVDPSTANTWNADFFGVYHFNNSINDGAASGNNLTNVNTTNLATSIIGEGRDLNNNTDVLSSNAAGQHLVVPNGVFTGITNFTWSGWVYMDRDATNWERIFDFGQSTTINFFFTPSIGTASPEQTRARITTGGGGAEQGAIIANSEANTGVWIYWAVTVDHGANTLSVYRNGALYGTATGVTLRPNNMEASTANYFGRSKYGADHYIDAKFDEFRLSSATHTLDWITTEYNNQSSPAIFCSISDEVNAGNICAILPIELINFNAISMQNNDVEIVWATASEINNAYFTVERSQDGITWEIVKKINGAGNSSSVLNYNAIDSYPFSGISYYRLKQTDFDGQSSYSEIRSVTIQDTQITIYPNPTNNHITLTDNKAELGQILICDMLGRDVTPQTQQINKTESIVVVDLSNLNPGIYIVKTKTTASIVYKE
ncbi:MAG: DUF2341 domain-containing protein [Bacteroidetes bacterium]|nr:DUF2341 domain-containing protein [Bacteroidota bacterium]